MQRRFITVLVLIVGVLIFLPHNISAASVTIHPLRQVLQLQPGQTVPKSLNVYNTTKKRETIKVSATSFNIIDKNYNYAFGGPPDLSSWIQFIEDSAELLPGRLHTFKYNVAVPNDAEPGGKYIVVFASTNTKSKTDGQVKSVVERAGSLIYLNVTGKTSMIGSLLSFTTPKISFSKTNPWNLQIQNKGNTHFNSTINTELSQWPGKVSFKSSQEHLILPGTIRELSGTYKLGNWPSLYRLKVTVGLGDSQASQKSYWLIYLPTLTSTVLGILIVIIVGIMIRKLKQGSPIKKNN